MSRTHAIILAGGAGDRFGGDTPKQFIRLAGESILVRSLRAVAAAGLDSLVVVSHPDWLAETEAALVEARLPMPARAVAGGATRNESTRNGLASLDAEDDDVIVVHDAVRPLTPLSVIQRAIEPVAQGAVDATDTVIASADTLVVVEDEMVVEIPDRGRFRRGQTPQVFRRDILAAAYVAAEAVGDLGATDDCSLVLRHVPGARVMAVAGDEINIKITTRIDLVMADRMIQMRTLALGPALQTSYPMNGARVLVIGGTNGIGKAIAEAATQHGARVAVAGASLGLDVRDPVAVESRLAAAADVLGGLDHVVCTAGVLRVGRVADTSADELAEVIDVNLTGSLLVARAAYPYLRARRGSLTVFASSSFTRGRPDYVAYSASKAAVVNMAQGLAEEWAEDGIRVNAVSPERTDTPMRRRAFPDESREGLLGADEVALATIRLLCSELTGQVIDVRRQDTATPELAARP